MGDDYVSDNDSEDAKEEEDDSEDDDSEDSEYGSENQEAVSELQGNIGDGKSSVMRKKKGASSKLSDGMEI